MDVRTMNEERLGKFITGGQWIMFYGYCEVLKELSNVLKESKSSSTFFPSSYN